MPFRAWFYAAALGCVIASAAFSQETEPPAVEVIPPSEQPVTGGETSAGDSNDEAEDKDGSAASSLNQEPPPSAQVAAPPAERIPGEDYCETAEERRTARCRELAAQLDMSRWAFMSMALTGAGVLLIWRTLVATKDAARYAKIAAEAGQEATRQAKLTNAIARSQSRTWIALRREVNCIFSDRGHAGRLQWGFDFENVGKSPAFNVRLEIALWKSDRFVGPLDRLSEFADECRRKAGMGSTQPVLHPGERTEYVKDHREWRQIYLNGLQRVDETLTTVPVPGEHVGLFVGMTYFLDNAPGAEPAMEVMPMILEPDDSLPPPYTHRMLSDKSSTILEPKGQYQV